VKSERADLYRVLQVDPSANPLVIQAAYRALAQIFHPDVSGDSEEMKRINAAWEVLRDPRRRRQYDIERAGRHAPQPPTPTATSTPRADHAAAPTAGPRAASHAPHAASASQASTASPSTVGRSDEHAGPPVGPASGSTIRFGRYEGWTIGQVARVDPAFLEWLRRVPLGRQLKPEIDLALQRADGARRMGMSGQSSNDKPVHTWKPGAPTRVG
jgi:curved DNA-binding protein CbpA